MAKPHKGQAPATHVAYAVTKALVHVIEIAGLPERELARKSGVHRSQLRRTIKEERLADIVDVVAICRVLDINPAKLISDAMEPYL